VTFHSRTGGGFKKERDAPVKRQDKGNNKKDNSKVVKKHISLDKLRAETKKKNESHGEKKEGKRFGRMRNKKQHTGKPGKKERGPKLDDEQMKQKLDDELEKYFIKGGVTEHAEKRLDEDLADYWKKEEAAGAADEAPAIKDEEAPKE